MSTTNTLTDDEINDAQESAYRELCAKGYNGGMGGEKWDMASARAIEKLIATKAAALASQQAPVAEPSADARDAARYRWLRTHWAKVEAHTDHGGHAMILATSDFFGGVADNEHLDAAIDAAMAAQGENK